MMRFEKRKQRKVETIKFLAGLESIRGRCKLDESNSRINLAIALKFLDSVNNDELKTTLGMHYTTLTTIATRPEELHRKFEKFL